jgi:hypothetical protein
MNFRNINFHGCITAAVAVFGHPLLAVARVDWLTGFGIAVKIAVNH